MLSVYGRRHHGYGVSDSMLDLMADCFIVAIQPPLEENWNKEVEEAWRALFRWAKKDEQNVIEQKNINVFIRRYGFNGNKFISEFTAITVRVWVTLKTNPLKIDLQTKKSFGKIMQKNY